jgi:hypothetical protein
VVVTGTAAGGSPTGTVTFYVCGPSTNFTSCTSTSKKVGTPVTLKAGPSDTATATSKAFKPTATGDWCFAGYYSGSATYQAGSDTSVDECFSVQPPTCGISVTVSPNPLVETGQSQISAVVQVEACPGFAGDLVSISSSQLVDSCSSVAFGSLQPGPAPPFSSIEVTLDDDGNATVSLTGLNCAPGSSLIEADLTTAPYLTATTILDALPPTPTTVGVVGYPPNEVETGDTPASGNSDVYAVFYVETSPVYAEDTVDIDSAQLASRCLGGVTWTSNQGTFTGAMASATVDDDGNAVIAFAGAECASGPSTVTADVVGGTHATYSTTYTIEPPQVTPS